MNRRMCFGLVFLLVACWASDGSCRAEQDGMAPFNPVQPHYDWRAQDYPRNTAVEAVHFDTDRGRLVADGRFDGRSEDNAKGEIYIDFRCIPEFECGLPVDLSETTVKVLLEVPEGFAGEEQTPSGIQIFGKCEGEDEPSQYSSWRNISLWKHEDVIEIQHRFSTAEPKYGFMSPGFDPRRMIKIGVKFAMGGGSKHSYKGPVYVNQVSFDPPIMLPARPVLDPLAPVLETSQRLAVKTGALCVGDRQVFLLGANWRPTGYGCFGRTKWFPLGNGPSKYPNYLEYYMRMARSAGMEVLRIGVVDDGQALFSSKDEVVGYDDVFRQDIRTCVELARKHGIRIEWVLIDFLAAGKARPAKGVQAQGHARVFTDPAVRGEFISKFLVPFLKEFGTAPAIAIDIMNEPEWIVSKQEFCTGSPCGGWEDVKDPNTKAERAIPRSNFTDFANACIKAIREHAPGILVTCGVSCINASLIEGLDLDYRAFHYYKWMGERSTVLGALPKDKPWVLEEFPTVGPAGQVEYDIAGYAQAARKAGGSGAYIWNLSCGIDDMTFCCCERAAKLSRLREWAALKSRQSLLPQQ